MVRRIPRPGEQSTGGRGAGAYPFGGTIAGAMRSGRTGTAVRIGSRVSTFIGSFALLELEEDSPCPDFSSWRSCYPSGLERPASAAFGSHKNRRSREYCAADAQRKG